MQSSPLCELGSEGEACTQVLGRDVVDRQTPSCHFFVRLERCSQESRSIFAPFFVVEKNASDSFPTGTMFILGSFGYFFEL